MGRRRAVRGADQGEQRKRMSNMAEGPDDVRYLRSLAARLRSLALTEAHIADRLLEMATEAENRAYALEARTRPPHLS